jgi:hypothetical protein
MMAKVDLGVGRCVHCLRHSIRITRDHVFPKSWYPHSARSDVWKWQIPACARCNSAYGRLEGELLTLLGLCVEPSVAEAAGIMERARRSVNPDVARDHRDAYMRFARGEKVRRHILWGPDIPEQSIYPGLGERWGRAKDEQVAVLVPVKSFRRLAEKIVRGTFFLRHQRYIEPPYTIQHYAVSDSQAEPIEEVLRAHAEHFVQPGIVVRCSAAQEDSTTTAFCIEIWGTFKLYAIVCNQNPSRVSYSSLYYRFRLAEAPVDRIPALLMWRDSPEACRTSVRWL